MRRVQSKLRKGGGGEGERRKEGGILLLIEDQILKLPKNCLQDCGL